MVKASFFESLIKVLNVISSMPFFIEIIILTFLLMIAMAVFYFTKTEIGKKTTLIIYCVTILLLPITHISFFLKTMDKIVENFVEVVYFPSVYSYILMILITDIFLLKRLISKTKEGWYVIFEFVYFFVFQFLFFLALRVTVTNSIDVFDKASIYHNQNLTSVIQILSYLFWFRIGFILIKWIINKLGGYEKSKNTDSFEKKSISKIDSKTTLNNTKHKSNNYQESSYNGLSMQNDLADNKKASKNILSGSNNNIFIQNNSGLNNDIVQRNKNQNNLLNNNELIQKRHNNKTQSLISDNILNDRTTEYTNFNSNSTLNNRDTVENIVQSKKDNFINNLDVSSNFGDTLSNFSIINNSKSSNNKIGNSNSDISKIQNSDNYDLNSVLSNISNGGSKPKNSKVNNNLKLDSNEDEQSKNDFYDDFYD